MFSLKKKMIEDMQLNGLKASTQRVYCDAISDFSKFHKRPPEELDDSEIRQFFLNRLKEYQVVEINPEFKNTQYKPFVMKSHTQYVYTYAKAYTENNEL